MTAKKAAAPATTTKSAEAQSGVPALTFGDAPVPEKTRASSVVNPLMGVCQEIAKTVTDGRSTIAKTVKSANDEQTARIKRWLAAAGPECGVTFRSMVDDNNVVTFWAVTRIEKGKRNTPAPK